MRWERRTEEDALAILVYLRNVIFEVCSYVTLSRVVPAGAFAIDSFLLPRG